MKEINTSVRPAGSLNKSRIMATVHYELSVKGAILSKAQYEQMPEELKSQVEVKGQNAGQVTIEAEFDIIDEIVAWTIETDISAPAIELLMG